jgi:hypothetical protein
MCRLSTAKVVKPILPCDQLTIRRIAQRSEIVIDQRQRSNLAGLVTTEANSAEPQPALPGLLTAGSSAAGASPMKRADLSPYEVVTLNQALDVKRSAIVPHAYPG